jgi:hypothetical protein
MKKRFLLWCSVALIGALVVLVVSFLALRSPWRKGEAKSEPAKEAKGVMPTEQPLTKECQEDLERIRSLWEKHTSNLDGMQKLAEDMERKWHGADAHSYCRIMQQLAAELAGRDWGDDKRAVPLSQEYALRGLERADAVPLEVAFHLLGYLYCDIERGCPPERRRRAEFWLKAWQRWDKAVVKDFDFSKLPHLNVGPPDHRYPAGVDPECISDPKARAEYEKAIAENAKRTKAFSEQHYLRGLAFYAGKVEEYIVSVYSAPPPAMEELEKLLDQYVADQGVRTRIVEAVRQNIAKQKAEREQ